MFLSEEQVEEILALKKIWTDFKRIRYRKPCLEEEFDEYLTPQERENIIDDLFTILN
jgi:hypothetical protein